VGWLILILIHSVLSEEKDKGEKEVEDVPMKLTPPRRPRPHLAQEVEAHPTPSMGGTLQLVMDDAPAPEISISEVTNSVSVVLPRTTGSFASQQITPSPPSMPHVVTDTARQSVPPPTGDEPLDAMILTTPQPPPSAPPVADNEMMDIPQQPMPPPTSPDMTTAKDGHSNAGSSMPEGDEQPGAVNPTPLQVKTLRTLPDSAPVHPPEQSSDTCSTDALKAHTSGLSEPDIDSLLELIQEDDGFEEESKPQRAKVAEAIVAVRDASQSEEWANLLRGIIILTTCLGFPKGDVSETCT
jgi:hypothetical protein